MASSMLVPPGGFAGVSQMAPASRASLFPGRRSSGNGSSRRRKRRKMKGSARRSTKRRSGSRKLKFGSPAWQRKYKVGKFARKRK